MPHVSPGLADVIVAEIDASTRRVLQASVVALGGTVNLAANGSEAITLASRLRASLVILDIKMSELDGVRACARIRALPGYEGTPIAMLTSKDTDRLRAAASQAGATIFLGKPLKEPMLSRVLSRFLSFSDRATPSTLDDYGSAAGGGPLACPLGSSAETACIFQGSPKPTGVIVADDDPLVRGVLKGKLEALGQDVFLAHNGSEAITLASRIQGLLVILDISMPKLDGLLACERIRALPGYAKTPIVMLTFNESPEAQTAASRAGATMFLVKPFGTAALMLALSRFLPIDEATLHSIHDSAVRAAAGRSFTKLQS